MFSNEAPEDDLSANLEGSQFEFRFVPKMGKQLVPAMDHADALAAKFPKTYVGSRMVERYSLTPVKEMTTTTTLQECGKNR